MDHHLMGPNKFNWCKQIQLPFGENLSFCFLFSSPPFGFFSLVLQFFVPLILLVFLFLLSPFAFFPLFFLYALTFYSLFFHPLLIFFNPSLFINPLLFCFPFSFVSPLCFFPSLFVPTPQFSLFLLHALSFLLLFSLANISPLSLLSFSFFLFFHFSFFSPPLVHIIISCPSFPCFYGRLKQFGRHQMLGVYLMAIEKFSVHPTYSHRWMVTEILQSPKR